MTRAEVIISDVDLLQLTAGVRILQIELPVKPAEESTESVAEAPDDDASAT